MLSFDKCVTSLSDKKYTMVFLTEPVAKGRPRVTRRGAYTPKKTKEATKIIADAIQEYIIKSGATPYEKGEPLRVNLRFIAPRTKAQGKGDIIPKTTKPDLDNYIKLVMDAANDAGLWHDDAQVVELLAQKVYAADYMKPSVTFEVRPL